MKECIIFGGGAGQSLGFEIKNGTTAPASPKENTLWAKSDTAISSWDFSPVQPRRRSSNRNLVIYPYVNTTHTEVGLTWTDNKNGTVEINGTTTGDAFFTLSGKGIANHEIYLEPGTYTFKGGENLTGNTYATISISYDNWATETTKYHSKNTATTFTLTKPALGRVWLVVESGTTATGTFKPQLEKASAATSFIMGTAEGQVWFKTGSPGEATINALKKNGIWLPVDGCKQYVNGVWTSKEAQVYQGGAWTEIVNSLVLFDGTDNTAATGGWTATGANVSASSVTITNSKMTFKNVSNGVSDNGQWYVGPKNKIDLTKYSVFRVVIDDISATDNNYIGVCSTQTYAGIVNGPAYRTVAGNGTYELDVASLSGEYYVGFGSYQNTIDSHSYVFSIFELDN